MIVIIIIIKTKVVLNKPINLGITVLDLSKTLMYKFHYEYIKPMYGDRAKAFIHWHGQSYVWDIQTDDFYTDISPDVSEMFDTSNFSPDHPSGIPTGINNKVIGMFKDEVNRLYSLLVWELNSMPSWWMQVGKWRSAKELCYVNMPLENTIIRLIRIWAFGMRSD